VDATQGPDVERIDRLVATSAGRAFSTQRQYVIKLVFADTKFNRAIRRFQRRGLQACRAEWRLIAATHNLLRLHAALGAASPGQPGT
jgi:hypothetical protein